MANDQGFGLAITFSSSLFSGHLRDVNFDEITRPEIDNSHNTTTNGWMTFQPSDLKDAGGLTCDVLFDTTQLTAYKTAIAAVAETITVTFPIFAGGSVPGTFACSGFMRGVTLAVPFGPSMMTASVKLKFSGEPTVVVGS